MAFILRDLNSLATARRSGAPLEAVKAQQAQAEARTVAEETARHAPADAPAPGAPLEDKKDDKKDDDNKVDITTGLEALRAVLPATFITLYSTAALGLQSATQFAGAAKRATEQAALATKFAEKPEELKLALQAMTVETADFVNVRILVAIAAVVLVGVYGFKTAQVKGRRFVILEPTVMIIAFIAWVLGAPGTVLAVYMPATELAVTTTAIVMVGAMWLFVMSQAFLKKKSNS